MKCRHCSSPLQHTMLDLGFAPPSNAYLTESDLALPEKYYPLKIKVCEICWLVQTEDYAAAEDLFNSEYAYFSSTSSTWLKHAAEYSEKIIKRLNLSKDSFVIEVASNDGYLLRNFLAKGIPCLGIEPTASTAKEAEKIGIPVISEFFGESLGKKLSAEMGMADLIVGNNVYAHVPDINDFTRGLKSVLKINGTITLEFPHLLQQILNSQFDTYYHEHFSYLSLFTVDRIFKSVGLKIWDVEQISTHGGSLRVYGCHSHDDRVPTGKVLTLLKMEVENGLQDLSTYRNFQVSANLIKDQLLSFLIEQKRNGKTVVAYGAAAKGNTLINYAGIKPDLLPFICDAALAKQGKYLPGSHIPILSPDVLREYAPDFLLILPWNIASEIKQQNIELLELGTQFFTAIPELKFIK